jgi:hypothetical protein
MAAQALEVLPGAVAFMLGEVIARVFTVHSRDQAVAGDLSDDRSTSNRETEAIAVGNAPVGERRFGEVEKVDKDILRLRSELLDGGEHGETAGFGDADRIDDFIRYLPRPDRQRYFPDTSVKLFTLGGPELLAVPDPDLPAGSNYIREDDGGGDHRSHQGAPPGFINAGDEAVALLAEELLFFK